jgi:hypothetical protein
MKTIKVNCEFASELVCVIPYAYWLHQRGQLEKVITSKGMKSFYYFCDDVGEKFQYRTFDINTNGLNDVPNSWIHHNVSSNFDRPFPELTEDEQFQVHGVLDYSQWTPPPYGKHYDSKQFDDLKPYVVINNNYNIEYGNSITESRRYFNIETLNEIFNHFTEKGYNVIYKRPDNTEFAPDQNEIATLQGGHEFMEITDQGVLSDYDLCGYYDNVYNLNDFDMDDYNEFQLKCFANADGFITTNGGGGILCAYFGKPVLFYVPHGKELRPGYLTKDNSYVKKLSNADIHVVLDVGDTNDYSKLITKMKDVFK